MDGLIENGVSNDTNDITGLENIDNEFPPVNEFNTDVNDNSSSPTQTFDDNAFVNDNNILSENNSDAMNNDLPPVRAGPPREEPEKIKHWREQQRKLLEDKDKAEQVKIDSLRQEAKKELDEWYKNHEESLTKIRKANRQAEKQLLENTTSPIPAGAEWERIADLCDFNSKTTRSTKDVTRMRSIILQLKQSPLPAK